MRATPRYGSSASSGSGSDYGSAGGSAYGSSYADTSVRDYDSMTDSNSVRSGPHIASFTRPNRKCPWLPMHCMPCTHAMHATPPS
jgi:hypothetical protein